MDNELNKKILITGATGFIGQHLVRALSQQGTHIYALTRTASNIFDNDNSVEEFIADITKPLTIPEGVTTIYHCAGVINDLKNMEAVNIGGTRNIVTATLQKDCKLIYVSSAGTVGKPKEKILDERILAIRKMRMKYQIQSGANSFSRDQERVKSSYTATCHYFWR